MDLLSAAYDSEGDEEAASPGLPQAGEGRPPLPTVTRQHAFATERGAGRKREIEFFDTQQPLVAGYVSKRKRRAPEAHQLGVQPLVSVLSPYLPTTPSSSSELTQDPHSRATKIPKGVKCFLRAHSKPVLSLEWHPNNPHLLLSASLDGGVRLWDSERERREGEEGEGVCVATYHLHGGVGGGAAVRDVEWAGADSAVSAGYDRTAIHMDVGYGRELARMNHSSFVSVAKVRPSDHNQVLTGDSEGKLQLWDLRCPSKPAKLYRGATGKILDAAFLPSGDGGHDMFVASTDIVRKNSFSQAMNVWELDSGVTLAHQLYFEPYSCPCLRVHEAGKEFLAQSNGGYVVVFSAQRPFKMDKRRRYQGHVVSGFDVGFDLSPDGRFLCSGSSEGKVRFYDYLSTKVLRTLTLTESACLAVAWSRVWPHRVAVSDWKGRIHILH